MPGTIALPALTVALCEALGLDPAYTTKITLTVKPGDLVHARAELITDDLTGVVEIIARDYVPKEEL